VIWYIYCLKKNKLIFGAKMNVLVVDDERLLLWSLERLFTKNKIGVVTVQSGEEAQALLLKNRFDWLITDLRLPGISGVEVLRFAKETQPDIRTIVISAFGSSKLRRELEQIGIDLYLDKPFDLDLLLETILLKPFKNEVAPPNKQTPKLLSLL